MLCTHMKPEKTFSVTSLEDENSYKDSEQGVFRLPVSSSGHTKCLG